MITSILSVILLSAAAAAPSASGPSFSCAKASTVSEKLICKHKDLALLDRQIAAAYAGALGRLDAGGDAALLKEQKLYLSLRDALIEPDYHFDDETPHGRLVTFMTTRRDFLRKIKKPSTKQGMAGKWENYFNGLDLKAEGGNKVAITGGGADPYAARWICDIEDVGINRNGTILLIGSDGTEGSDLTFTRQGDLLKVTEKLADEDGTTPYCGYRGSFEGEYFLIG